MQLITQTRADAILARITEHMASCDGTSCDNQGQCDGAGAGICGGTPGNSQCGIQSRGMGGGKGLDRGPGKGMGKGAQQPHDISPANVLHTAVSYASILLCFAVLTAAVQGLVSRTRRKQDQFQHTANKE